jgi:hypothetical protein
MALCHPKPPAANGRHTQLSPQFWDPPYDPALHTRIAPPFQDRAPPADKHVQAQHCCAPCPQNLSVLDLTAPACPENGKRSRCVLPKSEHRRSPMQRSPSRLSINGNSNDFSRANTHKTRFRITTIDIDISVKLSYPVAVDLCASAPSGRRNPGERSALSNPLISQGLFTL